MFLECFKSLERTGRKAILNNSLVENENADQKRDSARIETRVKHNLYQSTLVVCAYGLFPVCGSTVTHGTCILSALCEVYWILRKTAL